MKRIILSIILLGAATHIGFAQDKPAQQQTDQQKEIERLIGLLGADSYETREDAQKRLQAIGKPALPALRKACDSRDLETASRANELVERITGKRVEESQPRRDAPAPSPAPGPNIDPDAMKEMLDKLEQFGGLSPNLQKTLDALKEMMQGDQPDLGKMGELFRDLFGRDPQPPTNPTDPAFDRALGITVKPVSDALKAHLFIAPGEPLQHGLLVERVVRDSHAWKAGLRTNDIIIFINKEVAPTPNNRLAPEVVRNAWKTWRSKSTPIIRRHQLEVMDREAHHIEVIRRGQVHVSLQMPALTPAKPKAPDAAKKKERGF